MANTIDKQEAANRALATREAVQALDKARAAATEARAFAADLRKRLMAADTRQRACSHALGDALRQVRAEAAAARTRARQAAKTNRVPAR